MAFQKQKEEVPSGFIDLGEDFEKKYGAISATPEAASDSERPVVHYPELRFELDSLKELPQEGAAMIKYRKTMEREETVTREGKSETRYVCELEIHGIKPEKSKESKPEKPSQRVMKMDDNEKAIQEGLDAVEKDE